MELLSLILATLLPLLLLILAKGLIKKTQQSRRRNLPPGTTGLPIIGETLDLLRANKTGAQNNFIADRVLKYGSHTFRTSLLGSEMVVMCGPAANKFLFSNEGKKVALWWPEITQRLIGTSLVTKFGDEGRSDKKMMMNFFSPETLTRLVTTVDEISRRHVSSWEGQEEVVVYPAMKAYTFEIICWLLMNITEPELLARLAFHFNVFAKGLISLPLNLPGTRFYKAMRAADTIREELRVLLRERMVEMEKKVTAADSMVDMMSYLMSKPNGDGRFMPEEEIINNILGMLFAGHDTSSSALMLMFKYLAELPHVRQKVLAEQMEIAAAKKEGELLRWEDLQKMKYTWSVVCEIMRMNPPVAGTYREALEDFTFEGYTIPKGRRIMWSASFTHKDTSSYERPTTFDETRFEGSGPPPFSYVPFGGGPRMCLGKEFSRMEMLVFIHNFICRFDWDLSNPAEKVVIDPFPVPINGLPVRPRPRYNP